MRPRLPPKLHGNRLTVCSMQLLPFALQVVYADDKPALDACSVSMEEQSLAVPLANSILTVLVGSLAGRYPGMLRKPPL